MNNILFAVLGGYEVIGILAIILVLFGAKKLPELARGLGQGIREFKKATNDVTSDLQRALDEDHTPSSSSPSTSESRTEKDKDKDKDKDKEKASSTSSESDSAGESSVPTEDKNKA